jgi:hypothetical protein
LSKSSDGDERRRMTRRRQEERVRERDRERDRERERMDEVEFSFSSESVRWWRCEQSNKKRKLPPNQANLKDCLEINVIRSGNSLR